MADLLNILGIALALAMDAFAVAIAVGLAVVPLTPRHVFRLSFHFGLFQFLMPVLGWLAGRGIAPHISSYDHWVAFALLAFVGGKMVWESFRAHAEQVRSDPTRGLTLVAFSLATSIDALAVGLSMAMLGVAIWQPSIIIGVVAGLMTWLGIVFGSRLGQFGRRFGRWAERAGGTVLILLGGRIVVAHLG